MKKTDELLEDFKRNHQKMTPKERVAAYHAFNNALTESLRESSKWTTKPR